ncbi:MAG: gamma-glutamylcyclotransferase family protein [Roseovarius sp.]
MQPGFFFGYGSLVNRGTHAYADAHPAQLSGWRRAWRKTTLREVAYLTAVPDETGRIDGLVAGVPGADWAALDAREGAYRRVPARHQVHTHLPETADLVVYAIEDGHHKTPDAVSPVLLSYIDVVVQGYLQVFGEAGVTRFFDTTDGWDAPILDDRRRPLYPRHQRLDRKERGLVDDMLDRVGARVRPVSTFSPLRG